MESTELISYIALGVSAITAISGFFVFLRYDRRLKNQAIELNKKLGVIYDFQIDTIKKDEANQNSANFLVKPMPYSGKGSHIIRISNIGKVKAQDIRLGENTFSNDNGVIWNSFKTISSLDPMGSADFQLLCNTVVQNCYFLTLIWNDGKNKDNSKNFSINI